jgi:hypothetical protein
MEHILFRLWLLALENVFWYQEDLEITDDLREMLGGLVSWTPLVAHYNQVFITHVVMNLQRMEGRCHILTERIF